MIKDYSTIENMIKSKDKDDVYLAACILRKDTVHFTEAKKTKYLKKISLFDRIKSYSDICDELKERELLLSDFSFLPEQDREKSLAYNKIQQIARLFNQGWVPDWSDTNQNKWYPYYEYKTSLGLGFCSSTYGFWSLDGLVAYYQTQEISDFVGKLFIDLYTIING